jgi:acylphosphatase
MRAVRIEVEGRVQGVGYRAWASEEAERLGLTGWVRNRRDGSVEAVVSGDAGLVETFLARCRQGPRGAIVSDVRSEAYEGTLTAGFRILPTV